MISGKYQEWSTEFQIIQIQGFKVTSGPEDVTDGQGQWVMPSHLMGSNHASPICKAVTSRIPIFFLFRFSFFLSPITHHFCGQNWCELILSNQGQVFPDVESSPGNSYHFGIEGPLEILPPSTASRDHFETPNHHVHSEMPETQPLLEDSGQHNFSFVYCETIPASWLFLLYSTDSTVNYPAGWISLLLYIHLACKKWQQQTILSTDFQCRPKSLILSRIDENDGWCGKSWGVQIPIEDSTWAYTRIVGTSYWEQHTQHTSLRYLPQLPSYFEQLFPLSI